MAPEQHSIAASNDDKREIFSQLHEHSVAIASLQSGVEGLASSTESGFRNIQNQIESLGNSIRAQRPQFGVISSILIAASALIVSLAGFALKSAVLPVQHDIVSNKELNQVIHEFHDERLKVLENSYHAMLREHGQMDANIKENAKIINEFNRLMLQNYVSGSVGAAATQHKHNTTE
jgi:hypothetical protein